MFLARPFIFVQDAMGLTQGMLGRSHFFLNSNTSSSSPIIFKIKKKIAIYLVPVYFLCKKLQYDAQHIK